jgi:16S rRNA (guanine966-N2)-methyltransferase
VIAGRWKGRRLVAARGQAVRPTTDRIKESLFAVLGDDIRGSETVDLCCGSGGLGIEALSRGADFCSFVDIAESSLRLLRSNLARCGADPAQYRIIQKDARRWLRRYRSTTRSGLVILADPPYRSGLAQQLIRVIVTQPIGRALTIAAVEHAASETLVAGSGDDARGWDLATRRYGHSAITLLRPPADRPANREET